MLLSRRLTSARLGLLFICTRHFWTPSFPFPDAVLSRRSCRRPSTAWSSGSTYTTTSHRINPSVRGLGRSPIPHTTPRSRRVQPSNKAQVILKWWNISLPKPPSSQPPSLPNHQDGSSSAHTHHICWTAPSTTGKPSTQRWSLLVERVPNAANPRASRL